MRTCPCPRDGDTIRGSRAGWRVPASNRHPRPVRRFSARATLPAPSPSGDRDEQRAVDEGGASVRSLDAQPLPGLAGDAHLLAGLEQPDPCMVRAEAAADIGPRSRPYHPVGWRNCGLRPADEQSPVGGSARNRAFDCRYDGPADCRSSTAIRRAPVPGKRRGGGRSVRWAAQGPQAPRWRTDSWRWRGCSGG